MARRRTLTPLAAATNICMELNDGDKQTLRAEVPEWQQANRPKVHCSHCAKEIISEVRGETYYSEYRDGQGRCWECGKRTRKGDR